MQANHLGHTKKCNNTAMRETCASVQHHSEVLDEHSSDRVAPVVHPISWFRYNEPLRSKDDLLCFLDRRLQKEVVHQSNHKQAHMSRLGQS